MSIASRGERREFRITIGLRAGYGADGVIFDVAQAVAVAERWLADRQARGLAVLSGMMTRGEIIYAKDGTAMREAVAIFAGEVQPSSPHPTDADIETALNDLGSCLAQALDQEEISIAYRDEIWLMRRNGAQPS
ncbi:MAG TPA: hypothetical protein VGL83_00115 [Stellaceae bacterium]